MNYKKASASAGIYFHWLPLTKPALLKKWLIKICRVNRPLSQIREYVVCKQEAKCR